MIMMSDRVNHMKNDGDRSKGKCRRVCMGDRIFLIPCQAICFASVVLEEKDEFNPKIVK